MRHRRVLLLRGRKTTYFRPKSLIVRPTSAAQNTKRTPARQDTQRCGRMLHDAIQATLTLIRLR